MPNLFDALKKLLKEAEPSAKRLADAVAEARRAEQDAQAEVSRLEAAKRAQLTADEPVRAKMREALAAARDRLEDAGLFIAELGKRHLTAVAAEDQQRRRDQYSAAKTQADAAAKLLVKDYGLVCQKLVSLLRTVAEAQLEVAAANRELPAGAEPLLDPETVARGIPAWPRKVIRETSVDLWCHEGTTTPLGDELQSKVHSIGNGQGYMVSEARAYPVSGRLTLERCKFIRVEFLPETFGTYPQDLSTTLRVPGLLATDAPFFSPQLFTPDGVDPAQVVEAIDDALAQPRGQLADERRPVVEHIHVREA